MSEAKKEFTSEEASRVGKEIGIDWSVAPFDLEQFRVGMNVELEHGLHDLGTNVTDDDPQLTAKIARTPERVPRLLHPARTDGGGSQAAQGAAPVAGFRPKPRAGRLPLRKRSSRRAHARPKSTNLSPLAT